MERVEWDINYGLIKMDILHDIGYWRFVLVHHVHNESATMVGHFVFNPELLN